MTVLLIASRARVSSRRALVGGRVLHRAHADDAALAGHQPRHRVLGADRARVGQADRGARRSPRPRACRCGPCGPRPRTPSRTGGSPSVSAALMFGHQQLPGPVVLAHVDGQAEVDVLGLDQHRLAVRLGVGVVHLRGRGQRPDHRVADQVGERHLAAAAAAEVVVDHYAVVDQELGRDGAHAGRGWHGEARGHVRRGAGGRPAQPDLWSLLAASGGGAAGRAGAGGRGRGRGPGPGLRCRGRRCTARRRGGGRGRSGRCGRARSCGAGPRLAPPRGRRLPRPGPWARPELGPALPGRGCAGRGLGRRGAAPRRGRRGRAGLLRRLRMVVGEEIPPGPVHRAGVCLVPLVELVNQPFVGPEIRARRIGSRRCTLRRAGPAVRWHGQIRGRLWGHQQTRRTSPSSEAGLSVISAHQATRRRVLNRVGLPCGVASVRLAGEAVPAVRLEPVDYTGPWARSATG